MFESVYITHTFSFAVLAFGTVVVIKSVFEVVLTSRLAFLWYFGSFFLSRMFLKWWILKEMTNRNKDGFKIGTPGSILINFVWQSLSESFSDSNLRNCILFKSFSDSNSIKRFQKTLRKLFWFEFDQLYSANSLRKLSWFEFD